MVFFVMTPCDSTDAPKRIRCPHTDPMLASVRKRNKMHGKKSPFFSCPFSPPLPPPPPPPPIVFESRLGAHNVLNNCTMTVDGTDFRIPQKGAAMKGDVFASQYMGKSTLRYELGVDILTGNLVWIQGPYPASKYTDIVIFNIPSSQASGSRSTRGTAATPTRKNVRGTTRIRQKIRECRGG